MNRKENLETKKEKGVNTNKEQTWVFEQHCQKDQKDLCIDIDENKQILYNHVSVKSTYFHHMTHMTHSDRS